MKTINRLASFIKADHRYVYLGTSVIAALGLAFSQRNPTPLSFLAPTGIFQDCLWAILWAWLVVSAAALVTKLMHWSDYREKSPFASERFRRAARLGSYVVVAIAVEGGGYGASTAAPIARKIFDAWLLGKMPIIFSNMFRI